MPKYSSSEVAKQLGLSESGLSKHLRLGKIPAPEMVKTAGRAGVYAWTEADIEHARKLLPKIKNGRKTRYQKQKQKNKPQAKKPVPHRKKH